MKNIILPICLVAAALCCGCNGKRENTTREYVPNNPELIRRMECQMEASKANNKTTIDKDSIRQKFNILANTYFPSLPNGILSATTHQLYRDAWAVPEDNIIDVGSQGLYLSYFILGYVADSVCIDSLSLFSRRDSTLAKVFTKTYYDGESVDDIIILNLIRENQDWVIDDLKMENGSTPPTSNIFLKQYLRNYIEEHRRYFRSEEWKSLVERTRNDGFDVDEKLQEIDDYFRKYPDLPSDSILIRYFYSLANSADQRYPWEEVFSTELTMLQKHSDAVPDFVFIVSEPTFEGLGYASEECFSPLCQCSQDTDSVPVTGISKSSTDKDSVLAIIDYDCYEKASCHKQGSGTLEMKLVLENGRWVVCDYGEQSSHKSNLEEYIKAQREYFRSEKWKSDVEKNLSGTDKKQAINAVDEYFRKYPD